MVRILAAECLLLALAAPLWAGEQLVYAVVYKDTDYQASRTEVFSINPETAERQLIFSDEKTPILLLQHLYVFHFPVVGGRSLFVHAAERGKVVPSTGNAFLYELASAGSQSFRRIAPVLGEESLGEVFVNPGGTRIGYVNRLKQRQYIFIHDVATGKLLHQVDVTDTFLDCFASSIGWLPRGERLFFSLDTADEDATSEESYSRVCTYLMDERNEHLTKLRVPAREGFWPPEAVRMIGVLATGEYVFETMQHQRRTKPGPDRILFALTKWNPSSGRVEDIGLSRETGVYSGMQASYQLSPSGKYLAAARPPGSSSTVSDEIWLKDLQTGKERKLLSLPTKGLEGPFLGLVGWVDH